MSRLLRLSIIASVAVLLVSSALAQQAKPAGVLAATELKTLVPANYFYAGQTASVQLRNSAGFRTAKGKDVLAGMVDTSGYSADIAQKYQGFFITETKLSIEGSDLAPGAYGFGFMGDKFIITDISGGDLFSVASKKDDTLKRAVPLKIVAEGDGYRLYAGKKWVGLKVQ
jgi:hypothetical protein